MPLTIYTKDFDNFQWIDIAHPNKNDLKSLSKTYQLNHTLLIDSIESGHLPKIEQDELQTFMILRAYTANDNDPVTNISNLSNKIAFFISEQRLITIHQAPFNLLNNLYETYPDTENLAIKIINQMMETFRQPLTIQSNTMDVFERDIFLKDADDIELKELYFQKTKARLAKKILTMSHHVLTEWKVKKTNKSKLQDVKETIIEFELSYDEVLEDVSNLMNTYLSIIAQKRNDVMKLLTVFSVFFLPLTFIAGIYGMNFVNMPELHHKYGYFIVIIIMVLISIGIYIWFKRKKIL